ncbi:MAG: hypothetical protein DWI57_05445 [Chloroflexi bacterium]|nr:MAG: hypothetical protein DWI57_05445 [Chloroflexota bacterium]
MQTIRYTHRFLFVFLFLLLAGGAVRAAEPEVSRAVDTAETLLKSAADPEAVAKIQAAMSAAPLAISLHATILDWPAQPGGDFTTLREGSNGYTCLPPRAGRPTPDPMCLDEIWLAFFTDRRAGRVPEKAGIGVAYMLQGGNSASTDDPSLAQPRPGEDWMIDPPHVMLLSPDPLDTDYYPVTPEAGGPWILYAGTPYEILMVPVDSDLALNGDRINDAMAAAPSHASHSATVLEWPAAPGAGTTELRAGDVRYTCLPPRLSRPTPDSMCLDPVWLAFFKARMAGEVSVKDGIGVAYMLQGGNSASTDDPALPKPREGEDWVLDPPHVMVLSPDTLDSDYFPNVPDAGGPWILYAGTPYEVLMIPVELGLTDAQMQRALLPLPPYLRETANIVVFDADWNPVVVRDGGSDLSCVGGAPFMAAQYAVCQHSSTQPFWVMGMQLLSGGMKPAEVDQTRLDAMTEGTLETPVVGAARYFLIGGAAPNLLPLMNVQLPYATSESTGFSSLPDPYRPWLMDAGTPNAHLMLPGK